MSDFDALYLWQPVIWERAPKMIDVTITPGQITTVGTGGPKFVAAVAERLGLKAPERSKVIPFRSQRFNDDTNAPEWKDRWPVAWCLLFGYSSKQKVKVVDDLLTVDAMDEAYRDDLATHHLDSLDCRILADFSSEEKARAAAAQFTNSRVGAFPKSWRVEVVAGKLEGDSPTKVLAQGDKIAAALKEAGGVVSLRS